MFEFARTLGGRARRFDWGVDVVLRLLVPLNFQELSQRSNFFSLFLLFSLSTSDRITRHFLTTETERWTSLG